MPRCGKKNLQKKKRQVGKPLYKRPCGIEDASFYALRHTFCTQCIELEFDIKSLSEILRHALNITINRYVHPSIELKKPSGHIISSHPRLCLI